jgi:SH3-like domain-containing protein
MTLRVRLYSLTLAAFAAVFALQAGASSGPVETGTRFMSLRSDKVNVRTGPGTRYPIEWVFVKKGFPVEVTAAHDTWRKVRDWEGTEGWVHQSMLSDRRALLVAGQIRGLRSEPKESAELLARLEPGVIGRLERCAGEWCRATVGGYQGWLKRKELWGVSPAEEFD